MIHQVRSLPLLAITFKATDAFDQTQNEVVVLAALIAWAPAPDGAHVFGTKRAEMVEVVLRAQQLA